MGLIATHFNSSLVQKLQIELLVAITKAFYLHFQLVFVPGLYSFIDLWNRGFG